MNDFITLKCPSCGGKLEVAGNSVSLVCQHCGSEHLVRREAGAIMLESFARCPKCLRNDRVEKITAILSSQTQVITGTERRTETYYESGKQRTRTVMVPVQKTATTDLVKKLAPPPMPAPSPLPKRKSGNIMILMGILLAVFGICLGISGVTNQLDVDDISEIIIGFLVCGFPTLLVLALSALLVFQGSKRQRVSREEYEKELERAKSANELARDRWIEAKRRWDSLYYCHRDDCVFVPGDGDFAPVSEMINYLYK